MKADLKRVHEEPGRVLGCCSTKPSHKEGTVRTLIALGVICLTALSLFAQQAKAPPAPVTGLKILSTTIDPTTPDIPDQSGNIIKVRSVIVRVQNTTDKTVVAYAIVVHEFDKDGKEINPGGAGVGVDHAGPDNYPNETSQFIQPGQLGSIRNYSTGPETVSVEAAIAGVVYEDCTWEGAAARMTFLGRQDSARKARAEAAQAQGARKAELERRAKWFEDHGPKDAQ
jgi:hypothetical protein